jgi:hypothetical protein
MALHDNVLFLGTVPTRFTRHSFRRNVENDYFNLYLLTFYQKMRLSLMSGELMRRDRDLHRNLREARALSDAFVMFRNHYWVAEVTLKLQGAELYRRFQRGLDAFSLYEAVSDEVRELQEYYERQVARNIEEATRDLQRDMAENVAATRKLQGHMTQHLTIVAKVQTMLEVIEIFLVSVYAAHLWEIVVSGVDVHFPYSFWEHIRPVKEHWPLLENVHWGALICAVLGALVATFILKPWRHRRHGAEPNTSAVTLPDPLQRHQAVGGSTLVSPMSAD